MERELGFRGCENQDFTNLVPQGRLNLLNLAQDASPGLDLKGRPVPQGRLKIGLDEILDNLQPSLRGSSMLRNVRCSAASAVPRGQNWFHRNWL